MSAATEAADSPPEPALGASPHWRVAALWPRGFARLVDGVVVLLAGMLPAYGLTLVFQAPLIRAGFSKHEAWTLVLGITMWLFAAAHVGAFEARRGPHNGQTPGKQLLKVRTVRATGGLPVGRLRAWMRAGWVGLMLPAGVPILALPILIGYHPADPDDVAAGLAISAPWLGVTLAVFARDRRTYWDWAFSTVVVQEAIQEPQCDSAAVHQVTPLEIRGLPRDVLAMLWFGAWIASQLYKLVDHIAG